MAESRCVLEYCSSSLHLAPGDTESLSLAESYAELNWSATEKRQVVIELRDITSILRYEEFFATHTPSNTEGVKWV